MNSFEREFDVRCSDRATGGGSGGVAGLLDRGPRSEHPGRPQRRLRLFGGERPVG